MIKFFRTIRRDLLGRGKTIKYLQYAIGEIVLVVIGILIALSINNKSDELADRKAEQAYYRNTKQLLNEYAGSIQSVKDYNASFIEPFRYGVELIERQDYSQQDSLGNIMIGLINYSDMDRKGNIYEALVNSGDIKLLQNEEIIERIRRLEETYFYLNRMETIHFDAVMSLIPHLNKTIRFSNSKVESPELLYSFESQNMFMLALHIMNEKDQVYQRALEEIDAILVLIEEELNQ